MEHTVPYRAAAAPLLRISWWHGVAGLLLAQFLDLLAVGVIWSRYPEIRSLVDSQGRIAWHQVPAGPSLAAFAASLVTWLLAFVVAPRCLGTLLAQLSPIAVGKRQLWGGLATGLAGLAGIAVLEVAYASTRSLAPQHITLVLKSMHAQPWMLAAFLFLGAVGAPLVEELVFRGLILNGFSNRFGWSWATLASSALFGFLHYESTAPVFVLFTALAGVVLAWSYRISGVLLVPVLLHILNNSLAFALVLFSP